jgi:hypothetical protein
MRVVARFASVVAVVAVAIAAAGGWRTGGARAAGPPQFSVQPAEQTVAIAAGSAQVTVRIGGVSGMAAFQFLLRYDAGVLRQPIVAPGPFLGSTGHAAQCPDPVVDDQQKGLGTVKFGCATVNEWEGVSGDGLLATVTFELAGGAATSVRLENVSATDALGNSLCGSGCATADGSVVVAGGDAGSQHGIEPAPTRVPLGDDPAQGGGGGVATAPSAPQAAATAPAASSAATTASPEQQPADAAVAGLARTPVKAAPAGVAGASGTGQFGTGAAERHRGGALVVVVLGALGAALTVLAAAARRRVAAGRI